jgi:hypothetical protein
MFIVNNILILPVLDPIFDAEYFHFTIGGGADDPVQPGINDHFFTYEAGESINGFLFPIFTAEDVHIPSQEAYPGPGGIDDSVLFGMHAAAEFITLAMRDVESISQTVAVFKTVFGFSGSTHIPGGDDLVIPDYDSPNGAAVAGTAKGNFLGDS